jgi:DNA-binding protein YbaB
MLKGMGGLGGLGDMAKMMKAAQEMQGKMAEMQAAMANTVVIGESGAGLVKARATAKGEVTGWISIRRSLWHRKRKWSKT